MLGQYIARQQTHYFTSIVASTRQEKKTLITAVKLISNIVSPATELRMQRVMSKGLKHCRI